jgi:hypothetical protein
VAGLREAEGVVPRDPENGRSLHLLEVGLVAPVARPAVPPPPADSAALPQGHRPADRVLGVPGAARFAVLLEARHRLLELAVESAARARPLDPPALAPQKRQPKALPSLQELQNRAEKSPPAKRNPLLEIAKLPEKRALKRARLRPAEARRKRTQVAEEPVPAPREGLRPAEAVEKAPVRRAALGGRNFFPRALCPRRGYSQVTALFLTTAMSRASP